MASARPPARNTRSPKRVALSPRMSFSYASACAPSLPCRAQTCCPSRACHPSQPARSPSAGCP
eukprot:13689503-Alexandrium_andersonii.AAC.1